jgi:predicted transposase/invertase (TIGR01784 family)
MTDKITPRVDIAFKKIFGVEENKDLLIALINSIVSEEDQVEDVTLLNPYNPKNFRKDKLSVLDIKAMGQDGKRFNIEIQISDEADYDKRALYYWGKLYTEQMQEGSDYSVLNKTIGIHILNFLSVPDSPKYHNVFDLRERENNLHFFKDIELHTIELNKFVDEKIAKKEKKVLSQSEELAQMLPFIKTALDRWVTFLARHDLLDKNKLPKEFSDDKLQKALNVLEVMNFTTEEREAYEEHLKWLRIEANSLKKMQLKSFDEGEVTATERIARNMLNENQQIDFVARVTGLSESAVKKLTERIKR